MRRLPGILLLTGAALVVIAALLVSGLRIALPHLDAWRPEILNKIESATGMPVEASQLSASWQNFGPTLEAHDIRAELKDGGEFSVKRVTLALDVWQSLLHMRWQFRDLTFWQLRFRTNTPITSGGGNDSLEASHISDLFLRQFDHFDLRDSEVSFLTPSGQRAELAIPQLTWLNDPRRHRAEGLVSLSSLTGQHGVMQVRMDLRDDEGLLSNGRVWLQADDIDLKPWLGKWMQDNIALETAQFSLEGWMTIDKGDVTGGDVWLKQGGASWLGEKETHTLSVDNLTAHITRENPGWQFSIPDTRITMDGKPWPSGALTLVWIPEQDVGGKDNKRSDELRIRASNLELAGLEGVRPLAAKLSPALGDVWRSTQPSGKINTLALDIPLQAADKTRFQASWSDLAWKQWKLLPGAEHFSGTLSGSVENGLLTASMKQAKMPYETVFRAPLEIADGQATISWLNNDKGFQLDGRNIDVKAKAVHARGGFRYLQPANDEPWLGILAGISTDDGSQAWRYFPENLMGKDLVDYLSGAIQGGEADNATLVYGGNPQLFPYKHNEGQFEVLVPLRNAKFAFQPDWPALTNLDIELDFINDGLWMKTDGVNLGGVRASNLTAVIPDYSKEKLLIDADIKGPGKAVGPYFDETPLKDSLGATLQELQLDDEGQFEVLVPLRNAKFAFQPDWPALTNLDIELDFINDGLWMKTDGVNLGGVRASNLTAVIPDYSKEKLLIDADIKGPGKAVGPYFDETPLKDSLGATLQELQLDGDVNARLHLDIPLNGELVTAKGEVTLRNNSLFIKPLDSTLKNLSGKFSFINGDLQSEPLTASWFNQPLNVDFSTKEGAKAYQVAVNLNGNWQPAKTGVLPVAVNEALSGSVAWDGKVGIDLPYHAGATYNVELNGDLKNVSSHLPSPLAKPAGEPLPVNVKVDGNLNSFELTGQAGADNHFNSRWLLGQKLTLDRAIWAADSKTLPPLPEQSGVELNMPPMNGAEWLALFQKGAAESVGGAASFPQHIT